MKIVYQEQLYTNTCTRASLVGVWVKRSKTEQLSVITSIPMHLFWAETQGEERCVWAFDWRRFIADFPAFGATQFLEHQKTQNEAIRTAVLMCEQVGGVIMNYVRKATDEEAEEYYCD